MNAVNEAERLQPAAIGWQAELKLEYARQGGRTTLERRNHHGPLVVQKSLYPEGELVCHGVIVHPPGGIAGGDALTLQASLGREAQVLLTTPGAGKWYKAAGRMARQQLRFALGPGAGLEWLPQENILFDGAESHMQASVELAADAVFAGWDIICFGRQARGEQWRQGQLRQGLEVMREGRVLWLERNVLTPQMRTFNAGAGLRGEPVYGSFIVAAGAVPAEVLAQCRQMKLAGEARYGVTALPEIFAARYLGQSAQEARQYFEALWQQLRPWYLVRPAQRPRIWNT